MAFREFLLETQSVYQGMIDQVPDAFKEQVKSLKSKIDAALTTLASKPTEQVPAALDASSMLNHVVYTLNYMQEMYSGTMDALNKLLTDFGPKATALQSLQGRLDKKELIEATEVETRVNEAKTQAVNQERERQKLLMARRSILAKADVPLPLDETSIDGDQKAFDAAQAKATDRTKKLKEIGIFSQLNAEEVSDLIYGDDKVYNALIKSASVISKNKPQADPLVGGRTEGGKTKRLAFA